jgi:uncharacterized protein (TIGR00725 family)
MEGRVVAVFGSSAGEPGEPAFEEGRRLGGLLAGSGLAVATGGYGGIMEAVSAGAHAAGGRVIGVTAPPVFPTRTGANRYVGEELRAASLTERIHEILRVADASIALDGSIGTFTELMVAWNLAFVARFSASSPKPVVAVGSRWSAMVPMLVTALATDPGFVTCVADVDGAVRVIGQALGRPQL